MPRLSLINNHFRLSGSLIIGLFTLIISGLAQADEDRRFTSERVFDLEFAVDPQISPDGEKVVYLRRMMDRYKDSPSGRLWLVDIRTNTHRPLPNTEFPASSVRWSPNGDRLVFLSSKDGRSEMRVHFMDSGQNFSLFQFEQAPSAPTWSPDGTQLAFTMLVPKKADSLATPIAQPEGAEWSEPAKLFDDLQFRFDGQGYLKNGVTHVFTIDAQGGSPTQVSKGDNDFSDPVWLDNDTLIVVGDDQDNPELDPIESDLFRIALKDKSITKLTQRDGPDHSPAVSANGTQIAYLGYDDKLKAYQQTDLYVADADGTNVVNVTENFDRSVSAFSWRGNKLLVQANVDGEVHLREFSQSGSSRLLVSDVGGVAVGRPYASGSFTMAGGTIAYTQSNNAMPSELAVWDGKSKTLTQLNRDLTIQVDFAPLEELKVPSRFDERSIQAWLALPKDFEKDASAPMILEIHGGPFAMYGNFFAAEIQRFAAEGYVTAYVNPRGSTGYGEEFAQLIDRAYPGNDYEDLMTVVDYLVDNKYVDPKRLFITGGSGGGVLTAWSVGKTDRFAAAATIKPVINWATMALAADISSFVARHWIRAMPWEEPELYWRLSPISLVGNVKTPTLVMVGEEDWRTPTWEAEQFYTALKLQKVDTALIRIPGASHSIASRPSRLVAKVDNIMGWFKKYDPTLQESEQEETAEKSDREQAATKSSTVQ